MIAYFTCGPSINLSVSVCFFSGLNVHQAKIIYHLEKSKRTSLLQDELHTKIK